MGYETYEQPMIDATIYYYDKGCCSSLEFCEKILLVLEKYGYDGITNIELGKHKLVEGVLEDYVARYSKKDLSTLDLKAEMFKWVNDDDVTYISFVHKEKRHWIWDVTWHKNYKMPDGTSISDYTFNYLNIVSSYESLENKEAQKAYIGLFVELSDLFEAFYGNIEDVATAVEVLNRTKEKVFNHKRIQTVYWGNYFGKSYCSKIRQEKLATIPCDNMSETDKGVFIRLTDNMLDSKTNPDFRRRKIFYKYLVK